MALSHACHASPPFSKILIKNIYSANFKEKFSVVVGNSLAWSFPQRTKPLNFDFFIKFSDPVLLKFYPLQKCVSPQGH